MLLSPELQNHWLWKDKPFAKGQAWVDLLFMEAKEKTQTIYRGKVYHVEPGQIITSENDLRARWGWSRTKVRNFLKLLEETSMIELMRDKRKTLITLLKHSNIQDTIQLQDHKDIPNPIQESIQDIEQKKEQGEIQLNPLQKQVIAKVEEQEKKPVVKQVEATKSATTSATKEGNINTSEEISYDKNASEPYQLSILDAIKKENYNEK